MEIKWIAERRFPQQFCNGHPRNEKIKINHEINEE